MPCLSQIALVAALAVSVAQSPGVRAGDSLAGLQATLDKDPQQANALRPRVEALGSRIIALRPGVGGESLYVAGSGKPFRDCAPAETCPEMLVVPPSREGFKIGSRSSEAPASKSEAQQDVRIAAFAVGRLEITVGQYQACVDAGGCPPPEWREPDSQHNIETGRSSYYRNLGGAVSGTEYPVVGVSWSNAQSYARWLSSLTGKTYRLLSEAEWEYAARAGTTTRYWWGEEIQPGGKVMAVCEDCGSKWDSKSAAPADQFEANPWGLKNVHGNVWEWVEDFYCNNYASGPKDGSARKEDNCAVRDHKGLRILRGGSAFYGREFSRSATRLRNFEHFRNYSVGFRIGRSLGP
jgi:formylglycine-generating enzyme required for sulfatase activity